MNTIHLKEQIRAVKSMVSTNARKQYWQKELLYKLYLQLDKALHGYRMNELYLERLDREIDTYINDIDTQHKAA